MVSIFLDISIHTFIGGTSIKDDLSMISKGVHIAVGTPGRLLDLSRRKQLNLNNIKLFVLDEADEMLSKGFKDQIYDIFQLLPSKAQVLLMSATMPNDTLDLANKFMRNPNKILVKKEQLTLEGIKQFYVYLDDQISSTGGENYKFETKNNYFTTSLNTDF
jgi:translation initiation factor 4A